MNKVYMHYQEKKSWYLKAIYTTIISLVLWGFYKNGFVYYLQGNLSFLESLKPLLYPVIGVIFCILEDYITTKKIKNRSIIEGLLLGIMIPPRFSIMIYIILVVGYVLLRKIIARKLPTISTLLLFKLSTIMVSHFILSIDYQNIIEINKPYLYGIIDTFFGRSVGNVGTTCIFILLIFYFIKTTDFYYKKELPIYIVASYSILTILYCILFPQENMLLNLLNSHVYFMAIILATVPRTSPAEKKYIAGFGILVGVLAFIFQMVLHFTNGIYLSLLLLQLGWTIFHFSRNRKMKE